MEIKSYLWNIIQYKSYKKCIPIPLPIPAAFENSNSGHLKSIFSNSGNFENFNSRSGIGPNPDIYVYDHSLGQ